MLSVVVVLVVAVGPTNRHTDTLVSFVESTAFLTTVSDQSETNNTKDLKLNFAK